MRLPPEWKLGVLGLILIAGVGLVGWTEHRGFEAASTRITQLVGEVATQKAVASEWQRQYARTAAQQQVASDGVTVTRIVYRTRRDSLPVHPVTPADTQRAIAQLPAFVQACDSLASAAAELQRASAVSAAAADSTIAAKNRVIATQDTLARVRGEQIDRLRRGPRVSAVGQALYDPFGHTYAVAVQGGVRIVGDWSIIARAEQRIEPHGARAYAGVSHPLF